MTSPELVIFGSLTIDNVVRADGEIMPAYFGGNAVYSVLGARLWSQRVGVVSLYGEGYPVACFDLLQSLGIDTGGIRRVEGPHRMNVAFAYKADGSRTRVIPPEILATMSDADRGRFFDSSGLPDGHLILEAFGPRGSDMPPAWWKGVKAIHCPSMPNTNILDIARTARAQMRGSPLRLQVDSPWHDNMAARAPEAGELLSLIDVLLPSEQDMENYRSGVPHDVIAADLIAQGTQAVVLKRGPKGCRIFRPGSAEPVDIPVFPVDAVDPTGAGDSFCGGFLAGFERTGDLVMAAHFGAVSASFCVSAPGLEGLVAATPLAAEERLAALSRHTGIQIRPLTGETRP